MELKRAYTLSAARVYLVSGSLVFASALVYYLLYRTQLPWPGYLLNLEHAPLGHLTDISRGAYPSFAFTLSIGLIAIALFELDKVHASTAVLCVWVVGLVHEVSMGTFSQMDVVAGSTGALIPFTLVLLTRKPVITTATKLGQVTLSRFSIQDKLKLMALTLVSATLATGTSEYEPTDYRECINYDTNGVCVARRISASPVYLSYADLRSAIKMSEPRELKSVSRIYLYENMLFINERNEGIHIIDNQLPENPERIGFLEIPGNTEISIRDNNLYADSYIDLVTLDLSNVRVIKEVDRDESIFPYDTRQNIPNNVELVGSIDIDLGVVVGYQ